MTFSDEHDGILGDPSIDVCVTPSDWVCRQYEKDMPSLVGRCTPWAAGVDETWWVKQSSVASTPSRVVLYLKPQTNFAANPEPYVNLLKARKIDVTTVIYGSYTQQSFREALFTARLLVGFTGSESQGLAWAEAWSMDVPTLLWYQDRIEFGGKTLRTSTAPYLTPATGAFFSDLSEFDDRLGQLLARPPHLSPRRWVESNMTDLVCARKFVALRDYACRPR